jgi:hypothetical protein
MTPESSNPGPSGQVYITPEAGPIDQGTPDDAPGAGQVLATPEGGPADSEALVPPTWHEHMRGPILGLDDRPNQAAAPATPPPGEAPSSSAQAEALPAVPKPERFPGEERTAADEKELSKWPPYRGKPVSDVGDALKYAAPIAAQAEKLVIVALNLSGRGLTKLAHFLEDRRQERDAANTQKNEPER